MWLQKPWEEHAAAIRDKRPFFVNSVECTRLHSTSNRLYNALFKCVLIRSLVWQDAFARGDCCALCNLPGFRLLLDP